MAGLWTSAGNNTEAANSMARAGTQTGIKTANTVVNPSQYATVPLDYAAPALASYLGGANDTSVHTSNSALPINGAIYSSVKPREKELA